VKEPRQTHAYHRAQIPLMAKWTLKTIILHVTHLHNWT
jgi:hypothetical protein